MDRSMVWRLLGAALLICAQGGWAQQDAARAALVRGGATAVADTVARKLSRNDLVYVGEVVKTGSKGLAQLVFPDRSMLYVKASSELRIDAFHFDPKKPEDDNSVTTVLKGGMRALSGLVGKRNPDQVEYKTRVSTIGIRGTAVDLADTVTQPHCAPVAAP